MSLKQDWQRERQFRNNGRLRSIRTSLRSIASDASTTNAERAAINKIEMHLNDIIDNFMNANTLTISFEKYERIKS